MKFSTRDRYALRLMVELANRAGADALVPLKEISDAQQISLKYLEQIVTPLTKAGLVLSVRGAQGGYRLARPDTEITAGEILRAVEGELTAIPCLASSVECPRRGQCHTLDFWSGLNDLINKYVDGVTLHNASLCEGGGPKGRRERACPLSKASKCGKALSPTCFAGAPSQRGPKVNAQ